MLPVLIISMEPHSACPTLSTEYTTNCIVTPSQVISSCALANFYLKPGVLREHFIDDLDIPCPQPFVDQARLYDPTLDHPPSGTLIIVIPHHFDIGSNKDGNQPVQLRCLLDLTCIYKTCGDTQDELKGSVNTAWALSHRRIAREAIDQNDIVIGEPNGVEHMNQINAMWRTAVSNFKVFAGLILRNSKCLLKLEYQALLWLYRGGVVLDLSWWKTNFENMALRKGTYLNLQEWVEDVYPENGSVSTTPPPYQGPQGTLSLVNAFRNYPILFILSGQRNLTDKTMECWVKC
ncbi:hypothetical protein BDA99DRAFT_536462 [Phascolomyces articulosus]|uniref:Uncharacterized protein n=1 Tax=Phascolomyces articulosus TaxID=60185 RepID=A0AAD5PGG7_9FUNG|nr:hypothetical protein BDA99DRAFT_536462 [Phascolomyces articulosus]